MVNNSLNDIISCKIDISNPVVTEVVYNKILLVVPKSDSSITKVVEISSEDDLLGTDIGFKATDDAYIAAKVAFAQNPAPEHIYVVARGTDVSVATVLNNAAKEVDFYGIHLTSHKTTTDVKAAADWAEANEKMFGFEYTTLASCPLSSTTGTYYRTFGMFAGQTEGTASYNGYAALALMAKCFGYVPGSETWHLKTLELIEPSALSSTDKSSLDTLDMTSFRKYLGKNVTFGGKVVAGEWIDIIRFRDWLKAEIQQNIFKAMQGVTKLPYTNDSAVIIGSAVTSALQTGQENGGISPTEFDADGEEVAGYTVYVPNVNEQSATDRQNREFKGITWSARLAGAIHAVTINGTLTVA